MKIPAVFLSLSLALIFLAGPSLAAGRSYEQCERIASKRYPGSDTAAYRAKERFIKGCMLAQKK